MLKIGYFADGKWGQNAFLRLLQTDDVKVMFVCVRCDTPDEHLMELAQKAGIDVLVHENTNSDDFLEAIKKYQVNLFVSMSFNQIFKDRLIHYPRHKTINCHAGKLPFYRGRNILNWALINDEKEFGITVHYMDEGIDTGDIIKQRTFPITDEDTYATLLEVAYRECPALLLEAVQDIKSGQVRRIEQRSIHPAGMYCGRRTAGDEIIDWNQTSRRLFNFIRAVCKPGPMATSYVNREDSKFTVKINKSRIIQDSPIYIGIPGQILYRTTDGLAVKTADSVLEILQYECEVNLRIGDRLV